MPELLPVEASVIWVKRNDEVMGAVPACPRILRLSGLDQSTGELDVVGGGYAGKVRGQEPGGSRVSALAADVRKGPGEEEELGAL